MSKNLSVRAIADQEWLGLIASQMLRTLGPRQLKFRWFMGAASVEIWLHARKSKYLVGWTGSDDTRALRGVVVGDHRIDYFENKIVTSTLGTAIGSYERMIHNGGNFGNTQLIRILLF